MNCNHDGGQTVYHVHLHLLAGRHFAGWRGKRAIYLYLGGFIILCLAYFGSRYILEVVLDRSWG